MKILIIVMVVIFLIACATGRVLDSKHGVFPPAPPATALAALVIARVAVRMLEDLEIAWRHSLRTTIDVDIATEAEVKHALAEARKELDVADTEIEQGSYAAKRFANVHELLVDARAGLAAVGAQAPAELSQALDYLSSYAATH